MTGRGFGRLDAMETEEGEGKGRTQVKVEKLRAGDVGPRTDARNPVLQSRDAPGEQGRLGYPPGSLRPCP